MTTAMTEARQTLRLFCKFLTHRVRTENLEVLYTVAHEFLESPPCFTRVEEMLYRVFPLVAILPADVSDPATRAKADKLLMRMRSERRIDDDDDANELHDLHEALRDRIAVANWDVLTRMYGEFKVGSDRTLRAFIALQPEAIAMLPMSPCASQLPDDSKHANERHAIPTAPTRRIAVKQEVTTEVKTVRPVRGRGAEASKPLHRFEKGTRISPEILEIAGTVRAVLDAVEATEPWTQVFPLSALTYPFDASKHPALATQFVTFWTRHARAVWQRRFWCRVPVDDHDERYEKQRDADKAAAKGFTKSVMTPLFDEFGAAFFVDLDARATRFHWWWYREPLVDLVQMADVEGVDYCVRYMKKQATKRFPTPHPQFHMRPTLHTSQSASMWATMKITQHIHDAIVRLSELPTPQTRRARLAPKASKTRKRARAPSVCSDDDDSDESI